MDDEHPGTRERYLAIARAVLTAALAVAEAEGAGLFVVPEAKIEQNPSLLPALYCTRGYNACRAAILAGRVSVYDPLTLLTQEA